MLQQIVVVAHRLKKTIRKLHKFNGFVYFCKSIKKDNMTNRKIRIINGPNLNLLGTREPDIYGDTTFEEQFVRFQKEFPQLELDYFQSNVEGELINSLHEAAHKMDGVILNAGAYTHTSVALGDAIKAIQIPVIEVHISNIFSREEFRHISYLAPHCVGSIMGFGMDSYRLALKYFKSHPDNKNP